MDPSLLAFLFGVGLGFLDEEMIVCPHCGLEVLRDELRHEDGEYVCPGCLESLEGDDNDPFPP